MDLATSSTVASAADGTSAPQNNTPQPDQDQFKALANIVLDDSGQYSQDQQLDAYVAARTIAISGKLVGMDSTAKALWRQLSNTSIFQQQQRLSAQLSDAAIAAHEQGGMSALLKAQLKNFDALSSFQQKLVFETSINSADYTGATRYSDIGQYRDWLKAQSQLSDYLDDARSHGLPETAQASDVSDPMISGALKIANTMTISPADFIAQVAELFGTPQDKIDLSPTAQSLVGTLNPTRVATPSTPRAGAMLSVSA